MIALALLLAAFQPVLQLDEPAGDVPHADLVTHDALLATTATDGALAWRVGTAPGFAHIVVLAFDVDDDASVDFLVAADVATQTVYAAGAHGARPAETTTWLRDDERDAYRLFDAFVAPPADGCDACFVELRVSLAELAAHLQDDDDGDDGDPRVVTNDIALAPDTLARVAVASTTTLDAVDGDAVHGIDAPWIDGATRLLPLVPRVDEDVAHGDLEEVGAADQDGDGVQPDVDDADPCTPADTAGACDADGDGVANAREVLRGTDPTRIDSDDDGVPDFEQAPLDACDPVPCAVVIDEVGAVLHERTPTAAESPRGTVTPVPDDVVRRVGEPDAEGAPRAPAVTSMGCVSAGTSTSFSIVATLALLALFHRGARRGMHRRTHP